MQEEGPPHPSLVWPLRLSRILRPEDTESLDESIPMRRALFWVVVWLGILVGLALYFKYARLLTPMLG